MSHHQRNLFEKGATPWEEAEQSDQLVATVVFTKGLTGRFDYVVPDRLVDQVEAGRRVRVPLGRSNRTVTGYCVALATKPTSRRTLKPLKGVVDPHSLLSPAMLRLTEWIAEHYLCPWGQVLDAVVPAGVRVQAGTRKSKVLSVAPEAAGRLEALSLPEKQALVMNVLAGASEPLIASELARAAKCTQAPITALKRKGLIVVRMERLAGPRAAEPTVDQEDHLALNPDQEAALAAVLEALNSRRHQTVLVHGVTGSGKTEVYIQAIREVVGFGRQAIVLVPEISLTPQTVQRFRSRFREVAVLHSHLTDAERHGQWQRIADGQVQVIVGARSAIFAPATDLGLIILDEEHETSFKQDSAPRYHAREVAIARARMEGIPLVLGSATPSLGSWHRARTGEYKLVRLPRRVLGRAMPAVGTLDMRGDASGGSRGAVSRQLHVAMGEALADGGQVILLLNRRGFSTHIQCPACGEVMRCPDCEIALTHHRTEDIALCHYCDHQAPAPNECSKCQFTGIRYRGLGTQRLEAEVRARFPNVRCLRMDTDTMQSRGAHERALAAFRSGDVSILLGTQMIAKGLDFPNVTLVGVINADTALHLPDFRAAERTFHLVTQVAGRTGRGEKGGRVLVQTFNPDHPAIRAAVRHDYAAFAAEEMPVRKMFRYPPFSRMIRLVLRGPSEKATEDFATRVGGLLQAALDRHEADARVLGPAPCPFSKLRGKYRFQIQLQGPDGEKLRKSVVEATADLKPPEGVQWIVDVDPIDML